MTTAGAGLSTAIERAIDEIAFRRVADPLDAATVPAGDVAELMARFGIGSPAEVALLALPVARQLAKPPISGYHVAVVGIEAETGDLVLGGNLEFPGTELTTTIHAEGFVALRARRRGHTLATLALRVAHPCAHCRQVLSETAAGDGLELVDTEGARLRMDDIYPWPFRPGALGLEGDRPGRINWPNLTWYLAGPPRDVAEALLQAGLRAHAPYSGAPSAVVLETEDGRMVSAGCVESVAFNSSITALQAALVELAAARIDPADIDTAWLARTKHGAVNPECGFDQLLDAVAKRPRGLVAKQPTRSIFRWQTGA